MSAFFIQMRPEQYFREGPTWHLLFLILGALFIFYSGTAHGDLILAYWLLFGQKQVQEQGPQPHRYANHQQHDGDYPQTTDGRIQGLYTLNQTFVDEA
jgi:hypothetical protein